jgi:magnesium chelatase family protein
VEFDPEKNCTCSASVVAREQKRNSGPLLNRIDIQVDVPRVNYEKLSGSWAAGAWKRIGWSLQAYQSKAYSRWPANQVAPGRKPLADRALQSDWPARGV